MIYVTVFCLCFPLRVIVSGLTISSLIYFGFLFVYSVRKCSNFTLLQFYQHHLLKRQSLLYCVFLSPLSKIVSQFISSVVSDSLRPY